MAAILDLDTILEFQPFSIPPHTAAILELFELC